MSDSEVAGQIKFTVDRKRQRTTRAPRARYERARSSSVALTSGSVEWIAEPTIILACNVAVAGR